MDYNRSGFLLACLLLGVAVLPLPMFGTPDSLEQRYRKGIVAYQQERYVQARRLLRGVFQADRTFVRKQGAAAYWLSRAYSATGCPDSSAWALREGTRVLLKKHRFCARLFDARLEQMQDAAPAISSRATDLYLQILGRAGADLAPASLSVLRKHVAQLAPLLGRQQLLEHVIRNDDLRAPTLTFWDGAGTWLLNWWRQQDPIPATQVNERLREHIRRVAVATEKFGTGGRAAGWDDRGEIYVRYGLPDRRDNVKFHDAGFMREVVRSGVGVDYSDFPNNEMWSYERISGEGAYLFVRDARDGDYKLGTVMDLLPRTLHGPFGPGDRQQNVAYSAMAALRYIYNRLPRFYNDRGSISSRLNGWFSYQESRGSLSGASRGREIGFGSGARRVYSGSGPAQGYPSSTATATIGEVNHQERQLARRRAKEMPRDHMSSDRPDIRPEIQYRLARFLDEDGTTRTEVYWGGRFASEDKKPRHLTVSAFRYDEQYRRVDDATTSYALGWDPTARRPGEGKRHVVLEGRGDLFHVAVQWDLHTRSDSTSGEGTRRQVVRIDSVTALDSDASQLEMSDLQLMTIPETGDENTPRIDRAVPHPYDTVSVETPLLLYFELYHLQKEGASGRTQYTVTYESVQRTRKNFFGRLFGDDFDEEVTSASSQYAGHRRSTREYIQLDLVDRLKRRQPTEVTVRVTDETTGQAVERSIDFRLLPPGASGEKSARVVSGQQ